MADVVAYILLAADLVIGAAIVWLAGYAVVRMVRSLRVRKSRARWQPRVVRGAAASGDHSVGNEYPAETQDEAAGR